MLFSKLLRAGAAASLVLTCAGVNAQSWSSNSTYGLYVNPTTGIKGNVAIGVAASSDYQNNRLTIKAESSKNGLRIYDSAGNTKLLQGSNGGLSVGAATAAPANGLYVNGATKLNGTLNVTGTTTLSTTTTGAITTGSLTTNYAANLKSSLTVAGASTFNGAATFNKNFVGKGTSNEFYNGLTINTGSTIYNSIRLKVESGWAQIAAYGYTNYDPMAFLASKYNFKNGNVGIGVENPTAKLHVAGKILCTGEIEVADLNSNSINVNSLNAKDIQMDMHGAADYVFDENYNLKSLSEVESYVNEHKHLPGMPSAAEMDANGVSVSKMSNLLLEKVEELTLHMIKLEKENAALKAKVESLSK